VIQGTQDLVHPLDFQDLLDIQDLLDLQDILDLVEIQVSLDLQDLQDPPESVIQVQQELLLQDVQVLQAKNSKGEDHLKLVPLDRLELVETKLEP
jgi:hypothetical protein